MKKIIDVGPYGISGVNMWGWLIVANGIACHHKGRDSGVATGLRVLADRIHEAPEVTGTTVLIDTADDEQVNRLINQLTNRGALVRVDHAAHVMRESLLAVNQPPIEEPMLFGAIARDSDNKDWVRTLGPMAGKGGRHWARGGAFIEFDALDAREIVSPGIDQTIDQAI